MPARRSASIVGLLVALGLSASATADPGTAQERAALFDYVLESTMHRTAFSPTTAQDIGVGDDETMAEYVRAAMLGYRAEMIAADTDGKLYYVLVKLNATRWDSHLQVRLVKGGLDPFAGESLKEPRAPIKFKPDYSNRDRMFLFVSDYARDVARYGKRAPVIGDRLISVNGTPADLYLKRLAQFIGRSSPRMLWWEMAQSLSQRKSPLRIPASLYDADRLTLGLESGKGQRYSITLPYLDDEAIEWAGHDDRFHHGGDLARSIRTDPGLMKRTGQIELGLTRYKGFEHVFSRPAFDLYVSKSRRTVLLQGHSFLYTTIVSDLDALMDYARANGMFDYAVIYDLTRGGGGDFEEYTLQKLQAKPFKIMFGNLRISDITPALAQLLREEAIKGIAAAPTGAEPVIARSIETPDNGTYLLDWLDNDLARAIREQQAYSSNVQFKNQVLSTSSDGILYPAREHFTGPMVLFTSPMTCSGADQFAAMFIENNLGLSVGMPEGGCSNTWEWDEVLKFPSSNKPVVGFSWTVGHSIGPDGAVLEGKSAQPRISVPLTRTNYLQYYDILMGHALQYIEAQRGAKRREPTRLDRITDHAVVIGAPLH